MFSYSQTIHPQFIDKADTELYRINREHIRYLSHKTENQQLFVAFFLPSSEIIWPIQYTPFICICKMRPLDGRTMQQNIKSFGLNPLLLSRHLSHSLFLYLSLWAVSRWSCFSRPLLLRLRLSNQFPLHGLHLYFYWKQLMLKGTFVSFDFKRDCEWSPFKSFYTCILFVYQVGDSQYC